MTRHQATRSVALVLAGAAITLAGCTSAQQSSGPPGAPSSMGSEAVTIGLTYIPNVQFSPVYVADEDGLYAEQGINPTIRHHGADEGLFTALAAGEEDVVVASGDEVLPARDQGMDLVSIGAFYQKYPVTVIVPEDSEIRSLADLAGHTIGVPGEYGSSWYGLLAALDAAGLTAHDVTVVSIGYTQQAALAGGQVDAVVGFANNEFVQFQQAGMGVRTLDLPSDTPLVGASLVTTRAWLDAHPDQARAVVAGTVAGIASVVDDPDHAVDVTRHFDDTLTGDAAVSGARAVLKATIPLFTGAGAPETAVDSRAITGEQDVGRWRAMGAFLATIPGLLTATPDVDAAVTNEAVDGTLTP